MPSPARLLLAAALLLAALAAPAGAVPADQAAALSAYERLARATTVPAGWTGNTMGCDPGSESEASIQATLDAVNIYRDFAGLAPVQRDDALNAKALAAALMMQAQGELSHEPPPTWACYSAAGAEGARDSNLAAPASGAAAIVEYVNDAAQPGTLGHRRWVLDPAATAFGTGSTGAASALYVAGTPRSTATPAEVVAWPPAGFVPWPMVYTDWSASITAAGSVDLSRATVTVTGRGTPRTVTDVRRDLGTGYGTGAAIAWRVAPDPSERTQARDLDVRIADVFVDGELRTFTYTVRAFPTPTAPAPAAAPPAALVPPSAGAGAAVPDTAAAPNRARAKLRRQRIVRRGRRLLVRMRIARGADGDRVRFVVRTAQRRQRFTARVRKGRVRLRVRLPRAFRRAGLRVTVRYPGNARLAPASQTFRFRRA